MQDRIARGVLSELEPQVNRAEIARVERQRPDNIDAWGWYRQGIGQLGDTGLNEASLHAALERFERAMQAAPPSRPVSYTHLTLPTNSRV